MSKDTIRLEHKFALKVIAVICIFLLDFTSLIGLISGHENRGNSRN